MDNILISKKMDTLNNDTTNYIFKFLDIKSVIQFMSTTQNRHLAKNTVSYHQFVNIFAIQKLWYMDSFRYVVLCTYIYNKNSGQNPILPLKFPANLKSMRINGIINGNTLSCVPKSINSLIISCAFFWSPKNMPVNITHLTLLHTYSIYYIPSNITHLTLLENTQTCIFRKQIINFINVTHLTLGKYFNEKIEFESLSKLMYLKLPSTYPHKIIVSGNCIVKKY